VTLTVVTAVPHARIFVDGVDRGPAGEPIVLPIADTAVTVVVRAPGYLAYTRSFVPLVDKELDVELTAEAPRPRPRPHPPQPPAPIPGTCPASDPDCLLPPR
jgi:hypothetical protein